MIWIFIMWWHHLLRDYVQLSSGALRPFFYSLHIFFPGVWFFGKVMRRLEIIPLIFFCLPSSSSSFEFFWRVNRWWMDNECPPENNFNLKRICCKELCVERARSETDGNESAGADHSAAAAAAAAARPLFLPISSRTFASIADYPSPLI